ncbi:MAG TPA: vanadium-dependent haloperoxidase, partial [Chitinophagaceae bacterium]|nr:vanadium-dependent haloperoxidase [Chitinophagaceae bacterium]
FWKDVPGATSPGHWLSILQQVIRQTATTLEKAALAYALTGAAGNDALIVCLKGKYDYNVVRPITFIREVMGQTTWSSFLTTPAHPEYTSAHSSLSMASAYVIQNLFGNIGNFTDHTYDYLNYAPRTYSSMYDIAAEAGLSRFYAGIHYKRSIQIGFMQGERVGINIFSRKAEQGPAGKYMQN